MNVIIENSRTRFLTSFLFWIDASWSTLKPAFTVENVIGIFNILLYGVSVDNKGIYQYTVSAYSELWIFLPHSFGSY